MKKLCLILLALTSCTDGPIYSSVKNSLPAPAANASQLLVYRPDSLALGGAIPGIDVNDATVCHITNNSFFLRTVPAQKVTIAASEWSMPGTSRISFTPKPGVRYYIRVATNKKGLQHMMASAPIATTVAGAFVSGATRQPLINSLSSTSEADAATDISSSDGPLSLSVVSEKIADTEILDTNMNSGCNQ